MIPLNIGWNNFTGWLADQKYQAPAGRYSKAYWFDTWRYDVKASNSNNLVHTYPVKINAVFALEKINWSSDNIIWLDSWAIYHNTTLRNTLASSKQWYNIWFMQPIGSAVYKLYYFHFTIPWIPIKNIHRTKIDGTSLETDYRSYTSSVGNSFVYPPWQPSPMILISEGNRIVFSYYNEIWQISNSEVVTKLISFPTEQNVVWITEFQWSYKVYTTTAFSTSKIYTWSWIDTLPDISVDLRGLAITWWVGNLGAYDYIMADWSLYLIAWVQYQKLYHNIGWRIVSTYDDKVVIEKGIDWKMMLFEYGANPWYAKWLNPLYIVDITSQTTWITAIDYNSNWLVFASFTKLYRTFGTRETWSITCYLKSMVFVWDNIQYEKLIEEIILKFSWVTNTLDLYVQINESWTRVHIWTWNSSSISTINHWIKIYKNMFLNPIWNFNTIKFQIWLTHTWTASGRIYWLDLVGKQDIWK